MSKFFKRKYVPELESSNGFGEGRGVWGVVSHKTLWEHKRLP